MREPSIQPASKTSSVSARRPRRAFFAGLFVAATALSLAACSRQEPKAPVQAQSESPQARIVERSAEAFGRLRENPRFAGMESYLARARAVMIFPRVVKASLIVGGQGGNGVMVARRPDGSWSDPAFYGLGAPSVGLQIGYQETTIVLFVMDDATLDRVMRSSLTLGTQSGAALGDVVEPAGGATTQSSVNAPRIYQAVESGGVYAGVSLDGYVINARESFNTAYYGSDATVRKILLEGTLHRPENRVLIDALRAR